MVSLIRKESPKRCPETRFTRLMEGMDPAKAVGLVNAYLDRMIAIAFEHDGTLDRIVGDAVAIMFSAPVEQKDHEQRALRCALAMHAFDAINRGFSNDSPLPTLLRGPLLGIANFPPLSRLLWQRAAGK